MMRFVTEGLLNLDLRGSELVFFKLFSSSLGC